MRMCKDICNHFINITRTYKVLRTQGNRRFIKKENYKRCGYCDILLRDYNYCPCCGNARLSFNPQRAVCRMICNSRINKRMNL